METPQSRQRYEAFFNSAVPAAAWAESFAIPSSADSQNVRALSICDLKFEREPGYFLSHVHQLRLGGFHHGANRRAVVF